MTRSSWKSGIPGPARTVSAGACRLVVIGLIAGLVLECDGGGGSLGPPPQTTGSLTVTITAPAGVTPSVTVSGPGGYHQTLSGTQTLSGLTIGSYTVTAAPVLVANPIVGTVYVGAVTGGVATVSAGATATVSVSYALRPGSGTLWVINYHPHPPTVVAYSAAQLGASTGAAPATALATAASSGMFGAAFDVDGNLWLTDFTENRVVEFTASQLGASGSPTPTVTLSATDGSLNAPTGLAFDASGNLWITNLASNALVEFTASQLAASGSPTPAVTLSATAGSLNAPTGLAFDASGNLWVTNSAPLSNTLIEFAASQLGGSGSPTPAVTLSATNNSLNDPVGPAFDASGNLWVANASGNTIIAFAASQLVTSGAPVPNITLSATGGSIQLPTGLAFDASGDLWVSNQGGNTVVGFAASQLVSSGAPLPNVIVSGSSLDAPRGLAFNPAPTNLPLK